MARQPLSDEHVRQDNIDKAPRIPNRLILCLDGTGNSFKGTPEDTNIVKLLDMFDRSAPRQLHYYQRKSELQSSSTGTTADIFSYPQPV